MTYGVLLKLFIGRYALVG